MSSAFKNFVSRRGAWVLLGLTLLLVLVVRVRLREMPLERDEGEYAYAGQLMLQGVPPYQAVYNMKLPGTYAAYAAIMAVFGQSPAGIHLGVMLVNLGSIVLIFLLGRKLLDETTGAVAAAVFALMSLSPYVLGLAGHATHFVTFFALAGILVLLKAVERTPRQLNALCAPELQAQPGPLPMNLNGNETAPSPFPSPPQRGRGCRRRERGNYSLLAASGLLLGLSFLMKQHGIFFGIFGALYLFWTGLEPWLAERRESSRDREFRGKRRWRPAAAAAVAGRERPGHLTRVAPLNSRADTDPSPQPSPLQKGRGGTAGNSLISQGSGAESAMPAKASPEAEIAVGRQPLSSVVVRLGAFGAGFILPYVATCLILWAAGVFPQFWFWTVSYAGKYASSVSAVYSADMLRNGLRAVVGPNLGLWLLPWVGALVMWWEGRLEGGSQKTEDRRQRSKVQSPESVVSGQWSVVRGLRSVVSSQESPSRIAHPRFFLTAFLFCSFGSISVGFYFRGHYFITLLPALALLSGVAVSRALHLLRHDTTIELFLALAILLLGVVGLGAALLGNSAFWFDYTPNDAVKYSYSTSLFSEAAQAGEYLKTNAPPSARVAVLGSEPEILFYSGRRSATGYIYTYPLMEEHSLASTMQQRMIEEIERAKPDYAVFINDPSSWLPQAHSERKIMDWWNAWWPTNMDLVLTRAIQGKAELMAEASPMSTAPDRPPEQRYLLLFKRKPK